MGDRGGAQLRLHRHLAGPGGDRGLQQVVARSQSPPGYRERRQCGNVPESLADVLVGGVERPGHERTAEGGPWPDSGGRGPRRPEEARRRFGRALHDVVAAIWSNTSWPGAIVRPPLPLLPWPPEILSVPCGDRVESDGESLWLRAPCRLQPELRVLTAAAGARLD